MPGDFEQELLEDFLLESQEIIEDLDSQLVALEKEPTDKELLNSIFRGFHTIKGGAGFLDIGAMVSLCHEAEELFNELRRGDKDVTPELMDITLEALDNVKAMFLALRERDVVPPADQQILNRLRSQYSEAEISDTSEQTQSKKSPSSAKNDTTEAEFDSWLEEVAEEGPNLPQPNPPHAEHNGSPATDEIEDIEFESILDNLYGPGGAPGHQSTNQQEPQPEPRENIAAGETSGDSEENTAQATLLKATKEPDWKGGHSDPTIRVDAHRLDDLMNLVGELVLARNRLLNLANSQKDHDLVNAVSSLDHIASRLQDTVMRVRMQPIRRVFSRFPRVVRDLARQLGKEVRLTLEGEETELDKNLIEEIADPLIHLLRNAVDHGIEEPATREATDKSPDGHIRLAASQEGDHITLTIEDDGAGIDPEALKKSAIEKKLISQSSADNMPDSDAYDLMFLPGFSTRTQVSNISGRGVGMDVVRTKITNLNGAISIDSEQGKGSRFTISLPLTLAILPTMMVTVAGVRYALPLTKVREIAELGALRRHKVDQQDAIVLRGETMPLVDLREYLLHGSAPDHAPDTGQTIILTTAKQDLAVAVDTVLGQQDVVVKPLDAGLSAPPGISGSTITGDGSVALILDIDNLIRTLLMERAA